MKYLITLMLLMSTLTAYAQSNKFFDNAKNVSIDYIDAPVRSVIEQMMKQGNVKNYLISNDVEGFVTLKLDDQKFETALKIMMRANKIPLLYKIENDVLIIEKRKESIILNNTPPEIKQESSENDSWEIIPLNFIDPLDLQIVFGNIINMRQFTRFNSFGNNMNSNNGGSNNQNNTNQNNRNRNSRRNR